MSSTAENEFVDRDEQGLQRLKPDDPKSTQGRVDKAEGMYLKMLFGVMPLAGQVKPQ